jgi:hypothetical protein
MTQDTLEDPTATGHADRRRESRFFLGLPVRARLAEHAAPLDLELLDVSASGSRFQLHNDSEAVQVRDHVAFGFIVPGWPACQAKGQVIRVDAPKKFALALDDTNEAFDGFVRLLTTER